MTSTRFKNVLRLIAHHSDLLDCINQGIYDKRNLEDELGISRSTLNRALNSLEEHDLIISGTTSFKITPAGNIVLKLVRLYAPFIKSLPIISFLDEDSPLDTRIFKNAVVVESNRGDPQAPVDLLDQMVESAFRIEFMTPVIFNRYVQLICAHISENDGKLDMIVDKRCIELLQSRYNEEFVDLLSADNSNIIHVNQKLPYGLAVIDGSEIWMSIHDQRGSVVGAIVNDTIEGVEWSREIISHYRNDGERVKKAIHV